jgi:hypothetical protein
MRFRFFCQVGLILSITFCILAQSDAAEIELIGKTVIPAKLSDKSGLTGKLDDGTPLDRLGGFGSGIAYTGEKNRYVVLPDRGPKDGATSYACRFHFVDINVDPKAATKVQFQLLETHLFKNNGKTFSGSFKDFDPQNAEKSRRMDPEGIRVSRHKTLYVSDEYGPSLFEFDFSGKELKRFSVPDRYKPTQQNADPKMELPPHNTKGRIPNRGFEGIAVSPSGNVLIAALQSPLIQDATQNKDGIMEGHNVRFLKIDLSTGKTSEFVYQLDAVQNVISEILSVSDHQFLVIERDSKPGPDAKFKKIMLIDTKEATDVSAVEKLPAVELPKSIQAAKKKVLIDLLDAQWNLAGEKFPEKIEGICFGPSLPDGRILLLVISDNDFVETVDTWIMAFAIDKKVLPDYQPQIIDGKKPVSK